MKHSWGTRKKMREWLDLQEKSKKILVVLKQDEQQKSKTNFLAGEGIGAVV
jgi:hypothetical protein